jgi:hypothetical protein
MKVGPAVISGGRNASTADGGFTPSVVKLGE